MSHSSNDKANWPNYILDAGLNRIHFGKGLIFKNDLIDLDFSTLNFMGATGPQGPQGDIGPAGKDGINGLNGLNGKDGLNGLNGLDGRDGLNGLNGEQGPQGPQGPGLDNSNTIIRKIDSVKVDTTDIKKELGVIESLITPKIKIVEKPVFIKEYIEVRTTKYVQTKDKKPDKIERFPPSLIPPSSIPGWIWDDVNKYYYKIKRGIKYIKINNDVWCEDEYIKKFKSIPQSLRDKYNHNHFGKTQ